MQAMAEANHMEFAVPTAGPMAPPETDAQPLEPSSSAAKGRGRARKNAKQALPTLSTCTFSHLPVTIHSSLYFIVAFCVALCGLPVFGLRVSVTLVSSLVLGASICGLSATSISLHAPHCTILVYAFECVTAFVPFGPYTFMLALAALKHQLLPVTVQLCTCSGEQKVEVNVHGGGHSQVILSII